MCIESDRPSIRRIVLYMLITLCVRLLNLIYFLSHSNFLSFSRLLLTSLSISFSRCAFFYWTLGGKFHWEWCESFTTKSMSMNLKCKTFYSTHNRTTIITLICILKPWLWIEFTTKRSCLCRRFSHKIHSAMTLIVHVATVTNVQEMCWGFNSTRTQIEC